MNASLVSRSSPTQGRPIRAWAAQARRCGLFFAPEDAAHLVMAALQAMKANGQPVVADALWVLTQGTIEVRLPEATAFVVADPQRALFSLGILACELLAGESLDDLSQGSVAVSKAQARQEYVRPGAWDPEFSRILHRMVGMRMPFSSIEEAILELEAIFPFAHPGITSMPQIPEFLGRPLAPSTPKVPWNAIAIAVGLTLGLPLAGAVVFFAGTVAARKPAPQPQPIQTAFVIPQGYTLAPIAAPSQVAPTLPPNPPRQIEPHQKARAPQAKPQAKRAAATEHPMARANARQGEDGSDPVFVDDSPLFVDDSPLETRPKERREPVRQAVDVVMLAGRRR